MDGEPAALALDDGLGTEVVAAALSDATAAVPEAPVVSGAVDGGRGFDKTGLDGEVVAPPNWVWGGRGNGASTDWPVRADDGAEAPPEGGV